MKDQEQNKNAEMDVPGTTDQGATTSEDVTKADFQAKAKEFSLVTETGKPHEPGINKIGNFYIHAVAGHKSNDKKVLNGTTIVSKRIVKYDTEKKRHFPAPYTIEEAKALLAISIFINTKKPMLGNYIKELPALFSEKTKKGKKYYFPPDKQSPDKRTIAELMKIRFRGQHPNSHQRQKFIDAILSARLKDIELTTLNTKGEKEYPILPAVVCSPIYKDRKDYTNENEAKRDESKRIISGLNIAYADAYLLGLDGSGEGYSNIPKNIFFLWDKYGAYNPMFAALYMHFITQHALTKKNVAFTYGELLENIMVDVHASFYADIGKDTQRPRWKEIERHLIECLNSFKRIHLVEYYKLDEKEPASRTKQCVAVLNKEWHDIQNEAVSKGLLEAKEHVKKKATVSEHKKRHLTHKTE